MVLSESPCEKVIHSLKWVVLPNLVQSMELIAPRSMVVVVLRHDFVGAEPVDPPHATVAIMIHHFADVDFSP